MRVCGIDPAPKKGLSVFDGQDHHIPLREARSYISSLETASDLLICWDAPLTGPPCVVVEGGEADGSAFSQRPIESFFSRAETGFKTPQGISVRGYSGCPHWALSRSLIGLPKTGPFDATTVPFQLISEDAQNNIRGPHVVEVHPALALWLWCRPSCDTNSVWIYKKDASVLGYFWDQLLHISAFAKVLPSASLAAPSSDDEIDARIAYVLGCLWLDDPQSVILLGDKDHGTFLLPRVSGLEDAFQTFLELYP